MSDKLQQLQQLLSHDDPGDSWYESALGKVQSLMSCLSPAEWEYIRNGWQTQPAIWQENLASALDPVEPRQLKLIEEMLAAGITGEANLFLVEKLNFVENYVPGDTITQNIRSWLSLGCMNESDRVYYEELIRRREAKK